MRAKRIHDLALFGLLLFALYWEVVKPILKVLFGFW